MKHALCGSQAIHTQGPGRESKCPFQPTKKLTIVFSSAVNPEALKNKKRDIAELPVVSQRLIIFTATVPGSLLGAEVPAAGFSTHNLKF